jgi:hypothetical protein
MTYTMTVSQKINHKSHPSTTSAKIRSLTATSGPWPNCDFRPLSWNNCSWFPTECCAPIQQQHIRQAKHTNNCMTIWYQQHEPHVMQHYKYILTYDTARDKGHFNLHFMALNQLLPLLLHLTSSYVLLFTPNFMKIYQMAWSLRKQKAFLFFFLERKADKKIILNLLRVV